MTTIKRSRNFIIILQVLYVFCLLPWAFLAGFSVMAFDTPGPLAYGYVGLLAIYPIVLIVAAIIAWVLYARKRTKPAFWVNLIPLPWLLFCLVLMVYILLQK